MRTRSVPPQVAKVVRAFEDRLLARFGAALCDVRVFGSYARGTAHEESDVDVFVLLDPCSPSDRRAVLHLAGDLFAETEFLISATVFDRSLYSAHVAQQRPLAMEIEREGVRP